MSGWWAQCSAYDIAKLVVLTASVTITFMYHFSSREHLARHHSLVKAPFQLSVCSYTRGQWSSQASLDVTQNNISRLLHKLQCNRGLWCSCISNTQYKGVGSYEEFNLKRTRIRYYFLVNNNIFGVQFFKLVFRLIKKSLALRDCR